MGLKALDDPKRENKVLEREGYELLTDWTFFEIGFLDSFERELLEIKNRFCRNHGYTKFALHFVDKQHIDVWGRRDEDYMI